ncbi:hypothetical protein K402DRAFT_390822 [Aulographum hederae CBS 113979]|uniref:Uncharacterized protein n=1 Tax=Aulographum hederae CBS 113979 TaxID=1176131 RepID=A0A6G1H852_9PEZI|nr:hypothetical protein K402DRAFT_390822 [Aulographum hederae CBS 113979]
MRAADVHAKTQDHAVNIGSRSSRVIMVNQGEHPENSQVYSSPCGPASQVRV